MWHIASSPRGRCFVDEESPSSRKTPRTAAAKHRRGRCARAFAGRSSSSRRRPSFVHLRCLALFCSILWRSPKSDEKGGIGAYLLSCKGVVPEKRGERALAVSHATSPDSNGEEGWILRLSPILVGELRSHLSKGMLFRYQKKRTPGTSEPRVKATCFGGDDEQRSASLHTLLRAGLPSLPGLSSRPCGSPCVVQNVAKMSDSRGRAMVLKMPNRKESSP